MNEIILGFFPDGSMSWRPAEPQEVPDPIEFTMAWLDSLNPQEVEQATLERMGGLGGLSTGEAFLEALRGELRALR